MNIMIAIIAEKPSVGQDIACVIGATEKKDGYMAGNGYLVTWALGHLVSLAMPQAYGYNLRVVTGVRICTSPTIQRQQVPVKASCFPAEEIIETQAAGYLWSACVSLSR